jgi:hypothetical protein
MQSYSSEFPDQPPLGGAQGKGEVRKERIKINDCYQETQHTAAHCRYWRTSASEQSK